jgi:hypothetical protein
MSEQTNLDLTDKQPTALMRLEAVVKDMIECKRNVWVASTLIQVLNEIQKQKPSELADLKQSYSEGFRSYQVAASWAEKWKQSEPNQP